MPMSKLLPEHEKGSRNQGTKQSSNKDKLKSASRPIITSNLDTSVRQQQSR